MDETQRESRRKATAALGDRSHFAVGFHTAFRNGLDNPIASHIHNLIDATESRVWSRFAEHAAAAIAEEPLLDAGILRDACLSWDPNGAFRNGEFRTNGHALRSGLRLLRPADWSAVTEFLLTAGDTAAWDADRSRRADVRNTASLLPDVSVRELVPRVLITPMRDRGLEGPVGEIVARTVLGEPDEQGRRRQVILGWSPRIDGLEKIETPSKDGFATFEEAYGAAIEHARGLAGLKADYRNSLLRVAADPEWARERAPAMERACRHLASIHDPGKYEGQRVRRVLFGPEYANEAYAAVEGNAAEGIAMRTAFDDRPLAERLEIYLRGKAATWSADGPSGFLVHLALYGDEAAVRRASVGGGEHWVGWHGTPWRGPREMLEAWNSAEGIPPGPHPVPDAGAVAASAP